MSSFHKLISTYEGSVRSGAKFFGITPSTFSRLRRGEYPDLKTVVTIMKRLKISKISFTLEDLERRK